MTAIRWPLHQDRSRDAIERVVSVTLANLVRRYSFWAVATVALDVLCQIIAKARQQHSENSDRWAADAAQRLQRALKGEG